jgi:hypothetical protein
VRKQHAFSAHETVVGPDGLHVKAISLGGFVWSGHWHWLLLLLGVAIVFRCFAALDARTQGRLRMHSLKPRLERPGYWRRSKYDYAPVADVRWKQLLVSLELPRNSAPSTVVLTPCAPDSNFIEPEAFLNVYGYSVVLVPTGYDGPLGELAAIQRFIIYHELAHATSIGFWKILYCWYAYSCAECS